MTVLLVAGSPSAHSRSSALLSASQLLLRERGIASETLSIRDLPAQALLLADFAHPAIRAAQAKVAQAKAIVVATPVYKAAYSGVLKVLLDLLPQNGLQGKNVLPLATGGSPHHMLALDYALRPVLQSLSADHILPGVYATDKQVALVANGGYELELEIATRLADAVDSLVEATWPHIPPQTAHFAPVHFSQVRCSV